MGNPLSINAAFFVPFLAGAVLATPVRAEPTPSAPASGHGPRAGRSEFPSHQFSLTPHPREAEISFHAGLLQPLLLSGFNAAVDLRLGRLVLTYSHGQGLEPSNVSGVLNDAEEAAGMRLKTPWTTGGGIGLILIDELYILADVKVHHFEASAGRDVVSYNTVTVGGEIGWRYFIWKGFHVSPVIRFWPNVWDDAPAGGVRVPTATGELRHEPISQGVGGLFVNVLVGWAFDL